MNRLRGRSKSLRRPSRRTCAAFSKKAAYIAAPSFLLSSFDRDEPLTRSFASLRATLSRWERGQEAVLLPSGEGAAKRRMRGESILHNAIEEQPAQRPVDRVECDEH